MDSFGSITDASNSNNSRSKAPNTAQLSSEETREILTPLAFQIEPSLFGIALANPWRRGVALLADLCFVAILSGAPGELLAVLVAVTLFNITSKKNLAQQTRLTRMKKILIRLLGAVIVFIVLVDALPQVFTELDSFENQVEQAGQNSSSGKQNNVSDTTGFIKGTISLAVNLAISNSNCEQYSCWQQLTNDIFDTYAEQTLTSDDIKQFNARVIDQVEKKSSLSADEITQLTLHLKHLHLAKNALLSAAAQVNEHNLKLVHKGNENTAVGTGEDNNEASLEIFINEGTLQADNPVEVENVKPTNDGVYKGLAWLKGLIEDLGLGFGWAAFYFTMFTALWHGQTLGKKLMGIQVLQLDGTALSVWDSFGRYGGYGAGIATGLLGFAQIFWDPNRQAIHDKISATIVVNKCAAGSQSTMDQSPG